MLGTWAGTVHLKRSRKTNLKCQKFKMRGEKKSLLAHELISIMRKGSIKEILDDYKQYSPGQASDLLSNLIRT